MSIRLRQSTGDCEIVVPQYVSIMAIATERRYGKLEQW